MAKIKFPSKLKICSRIFSIKRDRDKLNAYGVRSQISGMYGCTDPKTSEIIIDEDLDPLVERETVLHEIMHACCSLTGLPVMCDDEERRTYTEETFVECLDSVLLQVIRDNPEIITYLAG